MSTDQTIPERWLSKRELAAHYSFSYRWVEEQTRKGMPSRRIGGQLRFRLSEVDPWLSDTYAQVAA